ncbi:MAG: 16S rRNA (cytosine(1402)-N(4))-methyltransferase, partial [Caulobacterales bacterium]
MSHAPVLLEEVIAVMAPRKGAVYVDATFGGGGYTKAMLDAADCKVIAIDRDPEAFDRAQEMAKAYPGRLFPVQGRFSNMEALAGQVGFNTADGVAADFGLSSFQLDGAARGFSFMRDGPLDMRMDLVGPTAAQIVNKLPERDLAQIFKAYGEERAANR